MKNENGDWVLNGSKIFITNAGFADVFIIIAVTGTVLDKRGRKSKEISAFIGSAPTPASPWASTRRRWASAAPPPAS